MQPRFPTELFEYASQERSHAVGGNLVVAGRFDLGKRANRLHHCRQSFLEIWQPVGPQGIRLDLPLGRFLHALPRRLRASRRVFPRKRYSIIVTPLKATMNENNPAPGASLGA